MLDKTVDFSSSEILLLIHALEDEKERIKDSPAFEVIKEDIHECDNLIKKIKEGWR